MSLLGWIKNAIGLDNTPTPPLKTTRESPPPAPQVVDGSSEPIESGPTEIAHSEPQAQSSSASGAASVDLDRTIDDEVVAISVESAVEINVEAAAPIAIEPEAAAPNEVKPEPAPIIAIDPEGPPTREEIDRRRALVRGFFNDYWSSVEDKPASFAERLDRAEGYINERVAAGGEAWRLGPQTRKQLGLPPSKSG